MTGQSLCGIWGSLDLVECQRSKQLYSSPGKLQNCDFFLKM